MSLSCVELRGAGLEARLSPLGAAIVSLLAPDRSGVLSDIVLGYDDVAHYAHNSTYFGAAVGRCANRIAGGRFWLDGQAFRLTCNDPPNALHGGPTGFSTREWSVDALLDERGEDLPPDAPAPAGVRLSYASASGEEHYPGSLAATVSYLLCGVDAGGEGHAMPSLHTRFTATCDEPTLVNLVQHTYWNLGGHDSGSVLDSHTLRVAADRYTPVDATLIPTGELASVNGTAFDFSEPKLIGAAIPFGGHDVNFVLSGANAMRSAATPPAPPELAAELSHPLSGRRIRLFTDAPGLQLYTGGQLDGERGKGGAVYGRFGGLALESQIWPDAINHAAFPSPILRPGEEYQHSLVVQLSCDG